MIGKRPRVVFDCMIFLQAVINNDGPAAELLRHVERKSIRLFSSKAILNEFRDVLSRPVILDTYTHLKFYNVENFISGILKNATLLKFVSSSFTFQRDPNDEKYLNLAIDSEADYLVTRDRDMLDLMTGIDDENKAFRQRFRHLKIVDPVEMLKTISENKTS